MPRREPGIGGTSESPPERRTPRPLDPEVAGELTDALGKQRGARLAERLAQASEALDRSGTRKPVEFAGAIMKEAPDVAAAHEVHGLASYRLGMFKPAVRSLEAAFDLHPDPSIMPVIADCYRALGRWSSVDRVWREIREMSPSQEVLAEGRIVAAGALADQGDLRGALAVMEPATKRTRPCGITTCVSTTCSGPVRPGRRSDRRPALVRHRCRARPRVRRCRATAPHARTLSRPVSSGPGTIAAMPSMQFRAGVVAVVTDASGQVMAFERGDLPGAWQLPQGGIDVGETPARRRGANCRGDRARTRRRSS